MRKAGRGVCRQGGHKAKEVGDICIRHAGIGSVGKRGVIMPPLWRNPLPQSSGKLGKVPAVDAFSAGRDVGRVECAKGALDRVAA